MEIQNIFYGVAVLFLFLTALYCIVVYIDVTSGMKAFLSFLLAFILFFIGDYLRRQNI